MTVLFFRRTLAAAALCAVVLPAFAQKTTARDALRRFVTEAKTASGRFTQTVTDKAGQVIDGPSTGRFAFERPSRFAWKTEKPYVQDIVSDGKTIRLYDKDLDQLTVKSAETMVSGAPAALLFGRAEALENFTLTEVKAPEGAVTAVKAEPKTQDAAFVSAVVGFDAAGLPAVLVLTDAFGGRTQLVLTDVVTNHALPEGIFTVKTGPETTVLEDRTALF